MIKHKILDLKETCTGCFACYNTCPKDAIEFYENEEGFYFPYIKEDTCINCGLCDKICPQLNTSKICRFSKAYYGWSEQDKIRKNSSSGGIFALLAKYVLSQGGVVYGASFNYEGNIRLECHSTDEVGLKELQRSKYVQCYVGNAFKRIKEDLCHGKLVLYCGTPCQAAGLSAFIRNEENLIIADFLCHGVPSMSLLRMHLKYLGLKEIKDIIFRPKNRSWVDDFEIRTQKRYYRVPWNLDEYFYLFEKSTSLRRSCKVCSYCNGERCSDITLGDFWGVKNFDTELYDKRGLSLIMANTSNGEKYIKVLQNLPNVVIHELPKQYAKYAFETNRLAPNSAYNTQVRDSFISDVYNMGYVQALKKHHYKIDQKVLLRLKISQCKNMVVNYIRNLKK